MPTYLNPKIIRLDSLELTRELTEDEIGVFRPADFCITNYGIIKDLTIRFVDLNVQYREVRRSIPIPISDFGSLGEIDQV